jgi:glutamate-ammonia-ligase adenylyltransferase
MDACLRDNEKLASEFRGFRHISSRFANSAMVFSARIVASTPQSLRTEFRDTVSAARNMTRIAELAPATIGEALQPVLGAVADPDQALNLFVRFLEEDRTVARSLAQHPVLVYYAATIFGHSQWLGETVIQRPDLLTSMLRDESLGRTLGRDEYAGRLARFQAREGEAGTPALLARFKRREYVRIMLRDATGVASLSETTAELSAIADVVISEALRKCDQNLRNRYGAPQVLDADGRMVEAPFAVLALGKLGGNELNYSSDIDLLYVFGDGDGPQQAAITNREYFVRLGQELSAVLSQGTPDGAPFRIDLRLRPQGGEGELAVSLRHALDYYGKRAADWELQALIKVRHAAGDLKLAREFIAALQPLVYTDTLNFAAIETAVMSRERMQFYRTRSAARPNQFLISRKAGPTGSGTAPLDVKLDRGGIRDIEFLVQCLQRVYGGKERWLRSGGTMFSLQKLHDKNHISGRDFHELTSAYEFLRTVEHRLQLRVGQQVHQLPREEHRLIALARGLSPKYLTQPRVELLTGMLRQHMGAVRRIYDRLIHQQQIVERASEDGEFTLRSTVPLGREASQSEILQRLALDSPEIHRLARQDFESHTRANIFKFLGAAFTSAERYAALLEAREHFGDLLDVLASSDYLTELLVRHPEEVLSLGGIHAANGNSGDRLLELVPDQRGPSAFVDFIKRVDAAADTRLAIIRRNYRSRVFGSGARDVLQRRGVFDSLADNTVTAAETIEAAITLSDWPEGMAVFALGRLGTGEFDILSDADLVFVRSEGVNSVVAQDAAVRLMQSLSAYTREGSMFPVDARLRPHGNAGELVVVPAELLRYFETEAQSWEALTWTKVRFLCGAEDICEQVFGAAEALFRRWRVTADFAASLLEMRARLERADEADSIRTGVGGLYDLDYIAGYLLVCLKEGPRIGGNLRQRLEILQLNGSLSGDDCETLREAAVLFRSMDHAMRLVTGTRRKTLPRGGHARDAVDGFLRAQLPGLAPAGSLDDVLRSARTDVRRIFMRLFA